MNLKKSPPLGKAEQPRSLGGMTLESLEEITVVFRDSIKSSLTTLSQCGLSIKCNLKSQVTGSHRDT